MSWPIKLARVNARSDSIGCVIAVVGTPRESITRVATVLMAASLVARLAMYLAGYSNPTLGAILDTAIFGLLAVTFAAGAVRAAGEKMATRAGISVVGALCGVALAARTLLRFLG